MKRRYFILGHGGARRLQRAIPARASTSTTGRLTSRPETIPDFEAEFGVRVRYATYESNEEMLAKVLTGNSGWDVVFPTHNRLQPMRDYGSAAALAATPCCPDLGNLDPRFRTPVWDADAAMGRALYVERHRHRLQPRPPAAARALG